MLGRNLEVIGHHDGRRPSRSKKRENSLDRHVHAGHVDRHEHELLEGTREKTGQILQSSPNTFALSGEEFSKVELFAILPSSTQPSLHTTEKSTGRPSEGWEDLDQKRREVAMTKK